jgi:transposase-like protein
MAEESERRFSREFKLAALARMSAGENVSALARELGVLRKCLYQWRERYRIGGAVAVRSRGRPTKAESLTLRAAGVVPAAPPRGLPGPPPLDALAQAARRIAELEQKVGRQALELDFFQRALPQIEEARLRRAVLGDMTPTRSSKR